MAGRLVAIKWVAYVTVMASSEVFTAISRYDNANSTVMFHGPTQPG